MQFIEIKTLVDITKPPVSRPNHGTVLEQNQYKNWVTLQQCIGLRSNIDYDSAPTVELLDIKSLGFGSKYKGTHRVWTFRFRPDRTQAYHDSQGNIIGLLLDDVNQVPIIENLSETINITKAVFDLESSRDCNTVIKAHA